jgi:hypothetical protein
VRARHFPSDDARLTMGLAPREVTAIPFEATCAELRFGRELGARRISCHVAMGLYDLDKWQTKQTSHYVHEFVARR